MIGALWTILGAGLVLYAVTGGADFGGGLWDLFARGPRAEAHKKLIAHALGPIWETNHIWVIFVIVLLFTVFPLGFAAIGIALHVPLTIALFGIVLRGAAFVFRAYGMSPPRIQALWGRVFAIASLVTPLALGSCLAALSSGTIVPGVSDVGAGWATPYGFLVGLFALSLFAMLAAVYLAAEDEALAEDFRARAIGAELFAGVVAFATLAVSSAAAPLFFANLSRAWPIHIAAGALAFATIALLFRRAYAWARITAPAQVACVVLGWGVAMDRHLVLPAIPIDAAGTRPEIYAALFQALIGGAVLLVPSLLVLFRVFKKAS